MIELRTVTYIKAIVFQRDTIISLLSWSYSSSGHTHVTKPSNNFFKMKTRTRVFSWSTHVQILLNKFDISSH